MVDGFTHEASLQISGVPSLDDLMTLTRPQLAEQLLALDQFDFVVFRLSGENPMEFIQLLRILGLLSLFMNRQYVVAFWTMDSHHLGKHESRAQKYFDHVFIAHEAYASLFSKEDSSILPCSFSLAPESRVEELLAAAQPTDSQGVCAPFAPYPWQERNYKYFLGLKAAEELKLVHFFGAIRGGALYPNEALISKLLSYKTTLNVSLSDDLNMRNFEALALNRVLISNRLKSHELLKPWEDNIVFVSEDFSNIKEKLIESQRISPRDFSKSFLSSHSIRARLQRIIETLTGHHFALLDAHQKNGIEGSEAVGYEGSIGTREDKYSPIFLLARAKWPKIKSLIDELNSTPSQKYSAFVFVRLWLVTAGTRKLATLYGLSSTVRAMRRLSSRITQRG